MDGRWMPVSVEPGKKSSSRKNKRILGKSIDERHNRLFRRYVPKGVSIDSFSAEQILSFADEMNALPRKHLGYYTPEELFEEFLDQVYSVFKVRAS